MKQYQVISQLYENANNIYQKAAVKLKDLYHGLEEMVAVATSPFNNDSDGYALAGYNGVTVTLPARDFDDFHILYMGKKKNRGGGYRTSDTIDPKTGASYRTSKKAKRTSAKNLQEHQDNIKKMIRAVKQRGGVIEQSLLNEAKKYGVKVGKV